MLTTHINLDVRGTAFPTAANHVLYKSHPPPHSLLVIIAQKHVALNAEKLVLRLEAGGGATIEYQHHEV